LRESDVAESDGAATAVVFVLGGVVDAAGTVGAVGTTSGGTVAVSLGPSSSSRWMARVASLPVGSSFKYCS
jgi:hypothetical protein